MIAAGNNHKVVAVWQEDSEPEEALLDVLPLEDRDDVQWFVWNELWRSFNTLWAKTLQGVKRREKHEDSLRDGEKSEFHLRKVRSRSLIPVEFLDSLAVVVREAGRGCFNAFDRGMLITVDPPELYNSLEPPKIVDPAYWGNVVRAVDVAAAAALLNAKDSPEYGEKLEEFKASWRLLHTPEKPKRSPPVPGLLGTLKMREQNQAPPRCNGGSATALCDPDGNPAVLGSMGLWLDSSDFVLVVDEGERRGLDSAFDIGMHGSIREWPEIYSEDGRSTVFRGLVKEGGPCCAKRLSKVPCPDAEQLSKVSDLALPPLQSFANARAVRSRLGYNIVKGWAIYDLTSMEIGKGYVAECYWWNAASEEEGSLSWVDFTPRPEGVTDLVLAEENSERTPKRRMRALSERQLALSESLLCLRFPKRVVARRFELGTKGAIVNALQLAISQAEFRKDYALRRIMASACIRGATLEELTSGADAKSGCEVKQLTNGKKTSGSSHKLKRITNGNTAIDDEVLSNSDSNEDDTDDERDNDEWNRVTNGEAGKHTDADCGVDKELLLPVMQEVLSLLEGFTRPTQRCSAQEQELESFLEAGGVEGLVRLTKETSTWVAATAASALAVACHKNARVQARALDAGAARALADLFDKKEMQSMDCYAAEAAAALWRPGSLLVQHQRPPLHKGQESLLNRAHWEDLRGLCCGTLNLSHSLLPPRERRGSSWGRVLAFAQVVLGEEGLLVRQGTAAQPLVIWVLGAQDLVEGALAEEGFFGDANFVERAPTQVIIFGRGLRSLSRVSGAPKSGEPASVRCADYSEMPWLGRFGMQPPDFAAVLMSSSEMRLPAVAATAISRLPVVISTRSCPPPELQMTVRSKLGPHLEVPHTRNPFSTSAGNPDVMVDDNGWIYVVRGPSAITEALRAEPIPEMVQPFVSQAQRRPAKLTPIIFWGILDIKYNTEKPVLDRVKVLETGDGTASQFSNHGAHIKTRCEEKYCVERSVDLDMQHVVSRDKKLTHDLWQKGKFGHLVPTQACFLREYEPDLAKRIQEELGLAEDDKVVLKLCNRTRAAGVVVTPVRELDEVLEDLLQPPQNLNGWFEERICNILDVEGSPVELGLGADHSFEEQRRHWWSNECPVFVAEVWCQSVPTEIAGAKYDGTMRVGFVLRLQQEPAPDAALPTITAENLVLEWLGGYWKLPKRDMSANSGSLRDCVVSVAKSPLGTAPVNSSHLLEVYAALDNMVQTLYGSPERSSEELQADYADHPELAAFLTAKLGNAGMLKRPIIAQQRLEDANNLLKTLPDSLGKRYVRAFVQRAQGVHEMSCGDGKQNPEQFFLNALSDLPTNANALHLLGMIALQHSPQDAVQQLSRSLLLDPDFKGAYCQLALAYLRLRSWERARKVAQAGHERHPSSPQLAYHYAVACCQLALQLVDRQVEQTAEYKEVQRVAQEARLEREQLEEDVRAAKQEMIAKKQQLEAADAAKTLAKEKLHAAEKADYTKSPVKGTKLRCLTSMEVFEGPPNWTIMHSLKMRSVVTATGPPLSSDGFRMVPITPDGYADMRDLERLESSLATEERKAHKEATLQRDIAHQEWQKAVGLFNDAKNALKRACEEEIMTTISPRPVKSILEPELYDKYEDLRQEASTGFNKARGTPAALSRRRGLHPWTEADDQMIEAMKSGNGPVVIHLPSDIGWKCAQYRIS